MNPNTQTRSLNNAFDQLSTKQLSALRAGEPIVQRDAGAFLGMALVPASIDTTWAVLTDYDNFANFLPNIASSKVVQTEGDRKVVEQVDVRKVLMMERKSSLCTENIETPQSRIDFRLLKGDLQQLEGYWELQQVEEERSPSGEPQVLILQSTRAKVDVGFFEKQFQSLFQKSLKRNLRAIQQEVKRRAR